MNEIVIHRSRVERAFLTMGAGFNLAKVQEGIDVVNLRKVPTDVRLTSGEKSSLKVSRT